jgi:hypothetical protein
MLERDRMQRRHRAQHGALRWWADKPRVGRMAQGAGFAYRKARPKMRDLFKRAGKAPILGLSATVDYGDKRRPE